MILRCILLVLAVFFVTSAATPAISFEGPLQVNNMYPIFLHADQPYLDRASTEDSMSYSLSHSSTYTVQSSADWVVNMDMEITELNFRYKRVISDAFELSLEIPVLLFGGGFLDNVLEDYHDACGCGNYGREARPYNEFLYEIRRNDSLVVKGGSGTKIGDIRIALKKPLVESETYTLSLRGDAEIPVSSAKEGYSNGSMDFGIAVLLDKRISERAGTYWNAGAVFPGNVKGHEELGLNNYYHGGVALEYYMTDNFSAIVQLQAHSDIYPETGLGAVDDAALLIAFGGRYIKGARSMELSLTEDLNSAGVPDFIINLTYKHRL